MLQAARKAVEVRSFENEENGGDLLQLTSASGGFGGHKQQHGLACEEVQPNARTVYRYYNKLIQLFKRYSSPDHVIQLVEVALITLCPESDPEVEEHHSSLQSTLFACYLQLGAVEQAYNAMMGNADCEQRRICLRQFILNLCESGDLASLVSFNYQGLEEEFVSILESKARSARFLYGSGTASTGGKFHLHHFYQQDNFSSPSRLSTSNTTHTTALTDGTLNSSSHQPINYHHILYSYYIQVHNYRRAAQSMYDYYRQLRMEGANSSSVSFGSSFATLGSTEQQQELLQKQADALLIARNCLKLVDPSHSYVNKGDRRKSDAGSLKRKYGNLPDNNVRFLIFNL